MDERVSHPPRPSPTVLASMSTLFFKSRTTRPPGAPTLAKTPQHQRNVPTMTVIHNQTSSFGTPYKTLPKLPRCTVSTPTERLLPLVVLIKGPSASVQVRLLFLSIPMEQWRPNLKTQNVNELIQLKRSQLFGQRTTPRKGGSLQASGMLKRWVD